MSVVYLDSMVVVYVIENPAIWGAAATARCDDLRAAGMQFTVSDLVRLECRVSPLRERDAVRLQEYARFFGAPDVEVVPLTPEVCERAAQIRADYRFETADALHLAAALEAGCDLFLTNDAHLSGFPEIAVELLS